MSKLDKVLKSAAGNAAGDAANVEDVFSTYLYDGTGSSQTITNGIDLDGEGGMVWIKRRSYSGNHQVWDTHRGVNFRLFTENTGAQNDVTGNGLLTSFNTNGFSLGSDTNVNESVSPYNKFTSWTFRKAPRFFDVVTYTGNGVAGREIAHDLGCEVGMMIVKKLSTESWYVWHKSIPAIDANGVLTLNSTDPSSSINGQYIFGNGTNMISPTSTDFTLHSGTQINQDTVGYVAYLFAHDPDGEDDDGMIACGSFTTGSDGYVNVEIGWEPQYLLVKRTSTAGNWFVYDRMRGFGVGSPNAFLRPNLSNAEDTANHPKPTATGFYVPTSTALNYNSDFIYMAIRAPMMVEPEAGTEVFATTEYTGDDTNGRNITSGFSADFTIGTRTAEARQREAYARLTGSKDLETDNTGSEGTGSVSWDVQDGILVDANYSNYANQAQVSWMFKRAKGFFDVVAYTGNGTAGSTVNHSLGVVPEMVIQKSRSVTSTPWNVWHNNLASSQPNQLLLSLNDSSAAASSNYMFYSGNGTISSTEFGGFGPYDGSNESGQDYILYIFATLAGVSKCGNYTGTGTTAVSVDCGFSNGARFVLIKSTSDVGNWALYDSARGINTGTEPRLFLNNTNAESTNDGIDPLSSGFSIPVGSNQNDSGVSYIFLAIA